MLKALRRATNGWAIPMLLLLALAAARVLFICGIPDAFSKDMYAWLRVIDVLKKGGNPYSQTGVLNWPPLWMQVLYCVGILSDRTSIAAQRIIQGGLVLGDAAAMLVCYAILKKFAGQAKPFTILLVTMALGPILIFESCQHCNFDVFVGLWILLFVYAMGGYRKDKDDVYWLAACFFLGMGILTKTVPLLLSPLLTAGCRERKASTNMFGVVVMLMPVVTGMSVIYTLAPAGVVENVLGYRSLHGWYGITGLLEIAGYEGASAFYAAKAVFLFAAIFIFLVYWCYRQPALSVTTLVQLVCLVMISIPTFGPGYSPSYIGWYLPAAVILFTVSSRKMKRFLITGYILVTLTYMVEYAFFLSHGAFVQGFIAPQKILPVCNALSSQQGQVLLRLPMFIFYLVLTAVLLRSLCLPPGKGIAATAEA